jgi:hypothetical protein
MVVVVVVGGGGIELKTRRAKLIQDLAALNRKSRADAEQEIDVQLSSIASRISYLKTDIVC